MRYWIAGLVLLIANQTAFAVSETAPDSPVVESESPSTKSTQVDVDTGRAIRQMQQAYHNLDYDLSYIRYRQGNVEPIRLFHARLGEHEVEHRIYLNGPVREAVRRDHTVAFYEFGRTPYSIDADQLPGIFATLADIPTEQLDQNYDVLAAGKSRVAGRAAQVLRIVPRHDHLYGLYLWLDSDTSLPLRVDMVDRHGELVEQFMVIGVLTYDEPTDWMKQLDAIKLPPVIRDESDSKPVNWQFDWKPEGMKLVSQNQHRLATTQQIVSYAKLSDGIFDVSVYVSPVNEHTSLNGELVRMGATSLHSVQRDGEEITVVGEIPPHTASMIAESVRILPYTDQNDQENSHE